MHIALTLVALVAIVTVVGGAARWVGAPPPLILTAVGVAGSFVPFAPRIELTSELVLVGLLPPLLYAAALRTSLVDFRRNARAIALLSVGLVLFTTAGIGLLTWWVLPVPLAAAVALGAVVAPPDAVAATAIARRIGIPRQVVTVLEGESLVNDATAIVCLRAAITAIGGSVSVWEVGFDLVVSAVAGVLSGLVVAVVIGKIRRHIIDPLTDTSVSLICPFTAYLLAEASHGSGVLAVVVAGLLLGHKSPVLQTASSRIFERNTWATIQFVLENSVFLLLGLQAQPIVEALSHSTLPASRIVLAAAVVLVGVIVLRPLWVFPATYIPRLIPEVAHNETQASWTVPAVISWAGMRGVVTLAAVFVLPATTPHREVLVLIALVVTAGTLLLQGATLPMLVRRLGLRGPDPAEDALQEAGIYQRAATAGLARLDEVVAGHDADDVVDRVRQRSLDRANAAWERLGGGAETPSHTYARLRQEMLRAEREEVLRLRGGGTVPHEVLQRVLTVLDIEETILDRTTAEDIEGREEELTVSDRQAEACPHLTEALQVPKPRTPTGCEECLRDGTSWVHLRLCMGCGHVGCCDSSPERHAHGHFQSTDHPVMRSFETGEAWRWCFVDELIG